MTDVHSKAIRSYNMSRIKGKNTRPEILVRKYLHSQGFRFRLHDKKLKGSPDLVLKKYKTVIFINGCFWHGHEQCRYAVMPKTRAEWWKAKIERTKERDAKSFEFLKAEGWEVIVLWECQLKPKNISGTLESLLKKLSDDCIPHR